MRETETLIGNRYGRLTVIAETVKGRKRCLCRCACGVMKAIAATSLKQGLTLSCGCLHKERVTTHGMQETRFYGTWASMKQRCINTGHAHFSGYGGRGIRIAEEWMIFENFRDDMLAAYEAHVAEFGEYQTTIERIDNNAGYSRENCRWATWGTQSVNKRRQANNTSGITGVYWYKASGKWQASITVNDKRIHLGYFADKDDAIAARRAAEAKYHADKTA